MTLGELFETAIEKFPMANVQEDIDGEVIIYTGLMYDAPLGYNGFGPQNIPKKYWGDIELRNMTAKDLPNVDN
jgi:hypothetical protein|tara:strand:- start:104 stop:322 length:219 start_codon:yes stop_codon:yes gene_type:complete